MTIGVAGGFFFDLYEEFCLRHSFGWQANPHLIKTLATLVFRTLCLFFKLKCPGRQGNFYDRLVGRS